MTARRAVRDHYLPPDREAYRRAEPATGRVIVIAPTRAACETIELALGLDLETVLGRQHGVEIRELAGGGQGFGIMAATGTGKTLAIRPIAEEIVGTPLRVGVVNREREATPETPTWNVVIVTTGIARRWFQDDLIDPHDTLIVDEIHQTSSELELCLALGKRVGCRFIWLSATVEPSFYAKYLNSVEVLESSAFDPERAARVVTRVAKPLTFLDDAFLKKLVKERRGVAVFLPTRAEVEAVAAEIREAWPDINCAFYHGGEPIRAIRPFLEGTAPKPFLLAMTQAGQSALNVQGLDTVVIYDACFTVQIISGRNVLTRQSLGPNEILQMAGRVHGRVANGEVFILTDRDLRFETLTPVPPQFQLAGDSERVALTAAALGIKLTDLDLPVPLDKRAYRAAVQRLTERGIVEDGRLTAYGRDVEAMPVDRPWGEMLVHAPDSLMPFVAAAANVDSVHRMTREESDLTGVTVYGSDHLTAYNVYAEAVNLCGRLDSVHGLPRHLFDERVDTWAEDRGVLVKAIEDIALGLASVYRTLEMRLPKQLPRAERSVLRAFRKLVAAVQPFDLVLDGETASGERVRLSDSSGCSGRGFVAGRIQYFADRFGVPRGALEGTDLPFEVVRPHVCHGEPAVIYGHGRKSGLFRVEETEYFGFVLDRTRQPLRGEFPNDLVDATRDALARALLAGTTDHPAQGRIAAAAGRLDEYWRRSGGLLEEAKPIAVFDLVRRQLADVRNLRQFHETAIELCVEDHVPRKARERLDDLPTSVHLFGDKIPLRYEMEDGGGVAVMALREKQARRLRSSHLPEVDRPVRLTVRRGRREVIRATSVADLRKSLDALPHRRRSQHRRR